jgi:hypothetical protein
VERHLSNADGILKGQRDKPGETGKFAAAAFARHVRAADRDRAGVLSGSAGSTPARCFWRTMMTKLPNDDYRVDADDIERTRISISGGILQFTPEGFSQPIGFSFGGTCGCVRKDGIVILLHRGSGVMTHAQAKALLAFLREHEHKLTDVEREGDIHVSPFGPRVVSGMRDASQE